MSDWGNYGEAVQKKADPNDALAKKRGFKDSATMLAWSQRQRERRGNGDGGMAGAASNAVDSAFSWHPKVLLEHVLNAWNKAEGR